MKKILLLPLFFFLLINCKSKPESDYKEQKDLTKWDSLMNEIDTITGKTKEYFDINPNHFDTTDIIDSPIRIISREIKTEKDYLQMDQSYVTIIYKNISGKTITGLRMRWYCEDGFGEPVLMSKNITGFVLSIGEYQNDKKLNPDGIGMIKWEENLESGIRIVSAWPYEVAFSDKSTWKVTGN